MDYNKFVIKHPISFALFLLPKIPQYGILTHDLYTAQVEYEEKYGSSPWTCNLFPIQQFSKHGSCITMLYIFISKDARKTTITANNHRTFANGRNVSVVSYMMVLTKNDIRVIIKTDSSPTITI